MTPNRSGQNQRLLNLDLTRMAFPLILLVLFMAPYPRALFFPSDLLPFHVACAGILGLILIDHVIARTSDFWEPDTVAALAIPGAYALSYLVAVDKHAAVTEFLKYLNYFAVFYVIRQCVRSPGSLRNMMRVLVLSAAGVCLVGLSSALGVATFPGAFGQGSVMSTFQYRNALGGFLLAALANGIALVAVESLLVEALLLSVINYLTTLTIITTYSRGTWMVFPVAVAALVVAFPQQSKWKALYSSVVALSCSFLVLRKFWEAVGARQPRNGLMWLATGAAVAMVLELLWRAGEHVINQSGGVELKYRSLAITLAVIYTVTLGGVYAMYAVDAYPNLMARVLPKEVIQRAGQIKADETSLTGRVEYIKDALKIAARSPLIGFGGGAWNALYHMYQDTLYWSTETHSHYFQMLTEVGLLGVGALVALWFFVCRRVFRAQDPENDALQWTVVIGALVAVCAISVHAAIDFDLSMPANAYIVWALLAGTSGAVGIWLDDAHPRRRSKLRLSGSEYTDNAARPRAAQAAALLVVVAVLSVLPYRLYRAGHLGAEGARWLLQNNFAQAERLFSQALRFDPWNGGFYIDMAQAKVGSYFVLRDDRLVKKADEYIERAVKLQPYNLPIRFKTVDLYMLQGRFEDAARAAREVARILPMDVKSHEVVARTSVIAALHLMDIFRPADAKVYIDDALAVLPKVEELARKTPRGESGERPRPTPPLLLYTGQALVLNGQYPEAIRMLGRVRNDKSVGTEASLWLGLAQVKAGQPKEGADLLRATVKKKPEIESEVNRLTQILGINLSEVPR